MVSRGLHDSDWVLEFKLIDDQPNCCAVTLGGPLQLQLQHPAVSYTVLTYARVHSS